MYRGIAVASLIALTSLVFVYSGFVPHALWLRALGDEPADVGGPRQPSPTRDEATGKSARRDDAAADRSPSGDAVTPPPKAPSPAAEDGHWIFIKSASDYEARLQTADALATTLAEKLSDTERSAAAQIESMQRQLSGEQARSADLDRALALARRSEPGPAGGGAAQASPAASEEVAALRTSLQAAAARTADAQSAAAAQADALQRRIGDEQARAAGLDGALREARDRLSQDEKRRSVADAQAAALTSALAATRLQVADLQRDVGQVQDLSKALADQRARSAGLAHDLSDARASLAQAVQKGAADGERAAAAESAAAAAKGDAARLQSAQEALAGRLADLEQRAAAQAAASQQEVAGQKARVAALDEDAARMRGLIAQAAERASASDAAAAGLRDAQRGASDKVTATERAFGQQLGELQTRLGAEQAKTAGLEKDLAAERARAIRSDQAEAAAEAGRRSSEAGARDAAAASNGALQALRDAAAEAERKATAQIGALKAQAASAEARATALDRDVAALRDRNDAAERASGEAGRRLQAALADAKAAGDLKAAAGQRDALQDQLEREKARAAGLGRDLEAARTSLARAEADKADGIAADRRRDDADRALAAKLTEAERSAGSLEARADDALRLQRTSAAQLDAARTALAQEQARSAGLGRDLAEAHSALDRAAGLASAGRPAKLGAERQAAAVELANVERDGATAAGPRKRLDGPRDRGDRRSSTGAPAGEAPTAGLPPRADRAEPPMPGRSSTPGSPAEHAPATARRPDARSFAGAERSAVASAAPDGKLPDAGGAVPTDLPSTAEARVSLSYARDNSAARDRAVAFHEALRARGIDVADPVPVAVSIESDGVFYFYAQDKGSAEKVANGLAGRWPVRRRAGKQTSPLPKPGTIEVSIAG